jgi:hypothetical protein
MQQSRRKLIRRKDILQLSAEREIDLLVAGQIMNRQIAWQEV